MGLTWSTGTNPYQNPRTTATSSGYSEITLKEGDCIRYDRSSTIDAGPLGDGTVFFGVDKSPEVVLKRKKHSWIEKDGTYICEGCGNEMLVYPTPFCPWCGCPMNEESGPSYG